MKFDFDKIPERRGTGCIKYDMASRGLPEDMIPLWVADMDFETAPGVKEALLKMASFNLYGYGNAGEGYFPAVASWYKKHFGWEVEKDSLVITPGVVFALAMGVRAFSEAGDAVMLNSPVYYPFFRVIEENGRRVIDSPLVYEEGEYRMDFADIEKKMAEEKVKVYLLCSPHNPAGRVWKREELLCLEDLCAKYGVILLSDEIHSDFVWEGEHTPFLTLLEKAKEHCIVLTAPSKTFNLAGLCCSNIFIPNPLLKERFQKEISSAGAGLINLAGLTATQAAYESGEEWLMQVKAYIRENMVFMEQYIRKEIPELSMRLPQGTYLTWVDFRGLSLTEEEREDLLLHKAKIWLDSGAMFGKAGEGFERFNMATSRENIRLALERLKGAIHP